MRLRDAMFLGSINTSSSYHVFIQLEGACTGGAYVSNKTATGFTVQQQDGNSSNAAFSYRITAKRKHYENLRFATEAEARNAAQYNLEQVWPEVITQTNQQRQYVTNLVNNQLNSHIPTEPETLTEPPAVTEETVP